MKLYVIGFHKEKGRSGTSKDGRPYSIADSVVFDCIRQTSNPTHQGLVTKVVKISSENAFYEVIQDSDLISFVGATIDIETEGKFETIIEFSFSNSKLPISVNFNGNTLAEKK